MVPVDQTHPIDSQSGWVKWLIQCGAYSSHLALLGGWQKLFEKSAYPTVATSLAATVFPLYQLQSGLDMQEVESGS
jgi:hypothetical protein